VIFTQGCNLRCPYCHNSDLIAAEKPSALTWQEVLNFLEARRGKLDGVVFTGGEPLLQDDLPDAMREAKALGFPVKLDTNGTFPDRLEKLLEERLPDYVAMDLKASVGSFARLTGRSLDFSLIRESIRLIMESGIPYEFRTTLAPGVHTRELFGEMLPLISGAKRYVLQNLSGFPTHDPDFSRLRPFGKEEMMEFQRLAVPFVETCIVRNTG
jgi:pyruvate formate lyase activating enzyme